MKMKLKILAFIAIVTMSVFNPANAGFASGQDILSDCESEAAWENRLCETYLAGIVGAQDALRKLGALTEQYFCIPDGASLRQLQKIFVKYANENLDELQQEGGVMALNAFRETFPCE